MIVSALVPIAQMKPNSSRATAIAIFLWSIARLIRITSGNLRLLTRLLTQIEHVLSVNDAQAVSLEIVDAARDSLVIGQA
jgi:hypothetical protein